MQILFGGTFDPIHQGHLAVALAVAEQLQESVTLIPNATPPHKQHTRSSAQHRWAMLKAAISPYPQLKASDWELQQRTPSWTIHTLKHWRSMHPKEPLVWVIGADSLAQLHHWHRWEEFSQWCHLAVLPRAEAPAPTAAVQQHFPLAPPQALHMQSYGLRAHLPMPLHPVSSTEIRQQLALNHYSPHLPKAVMDYITTHGLYNVPTP